jgi:hypothetical protein
MKKLFLLFLVLFAAVSVASAQRASVSGKEVTGTFRSYFKGKYKGNYNQVKILAIGNGKLKVAFDLTYPHTDSTGQLTANTGIAEGTAEITGDMAIFKPDGTEKCTITIKFVKLGQIKITEDGSDSGCGFGFNVTSDGTYTKVSSAKPKFEEL